MDFRGLLISVSFACYLSIQSLLSVHVSKPSFSRFLSLSLSLHYFPNVKGGHKQTLVVARLEKHRNASQFGSLGLRCVALRTLREIIAFRLKEIRQYQHFRRQAETVQHISHFPFHFLKTFTQTDGLSLFQYYLDLTNSL